MISEKEILQELSRDPHPFIVNLATTFQDPRYLYMVLEYIIGGEFFTHLRNAVKFSSPTAQFYASHVVLIFEFLHSMDIIYRDLKPEVRMPLQSLKELIDCTLTTTTNNSALSL